MTEMTVGVTELSWCDRDDCWCDSCLGVTEMTAGVTELSWCDRDDCWCDRDDCWCDRVVLV